MKVVINKNSVNVIREDTDKKIYKESTFWYNLKLELIKMGYDVIRKDPQKETHFTHLTSMPFYIRGRKINENTPMISDSDYQIRFVYEHYNQSGSVSLTLDGNLNDAKFKS